MSAITAVAKQEHTGWRGQIVAPDGNVLTRTVNLYATDDKAIAGAKRQWAWQKLQFAMQSAAVASKEEAPR